MVTGRSVSSVFGQIDVRVLFVGESDSLAALVGMRAREGHSSCVTRFDVDESSANT